MKTILAGILIVLLLGCVGPGDEVIDEEDVDEVVEIGEEEEEAEEIPVVGYQDWPKYRYDLQNTGVTPEILEPPLALAWKKKLVDHTGIGEIRGVSVVGDVAYVSTDWMRVHALRIGDGEELWEFKADEPVKSVPAVYGGLAYVGSKDDYFYAIDTTTGKKEWDYYTKSSIYGSPMVYDGLVYIGNDYRKRLYAFEAMTGKLVWEYATENDIWASPAIWEDRLYINSNDNHLYVFEPETGELLWKYEIPVNTYLRSPVISEGTVFFGTEYMTLYAVDTAVQDLKWSYKTEGPITGAPAVKDGVVYFGSEDSYVYAVEAGTGDMIWRFKGSGMAASPIIAGDIIYVTIGDYAYALSTDGKELWKYETGGQNDFLVVSNGRLFVPSRNGYLYVFEEE